MRKKNEEINLHDQYEHLLQHVEPHRSRQKIVRVVRYTIIQDKFKYFFRAVFHCGFDRVNIADKITIGVIKNKINTNIKYNRLILNTY